MNVQEIWNEYINKYNEEKKHMNHGILPVMKKMQIN